MPTPSGGWNCCGSDGRSARPQHRSSSCPAHPQLPRVVTREEALAAPPDVLGDSYLQAQTLLLHCTIARAGAVIDTSLDGLPLSITSDNADQVRKRLEDRTLVYSDAILRHGASRSSPPGIERRRQAAATSGA